MTKVINELNYQLEGYMELKPHEQKRMLGFFVGIFGLIVLFIAMWQLCSVAGSICV